MARVYFRTMDVNGEQRSRLMKIREDIQRSYRERLEFKLVINDVLGIAQKFQEVMNVFNNTIIDNMVEEACAPLKVDLKNLEEKTKRMENEMSQLKEQIKDMCFVNTPRPNLRNLRKRPQDKEQNNNNVHLENNSANSPKRRNKTKRLNNDNANLESSTKQTGEEQIVLIQDNPAQDTSVESSSLSTDGTPKSTKRKLWNKTHDFLDADAEHLF